MNLSQLPVTTKPKNIIIYMLRLYHIKMLTVTLTLFLLMVWIRYMYIQHKQPKIYKNRKKNWRLIIIADMTEVF